MSASAQSGDRLAKYLLGLSRRIRKEVYTESQYFSLGTICELLQGVRIRSYDSFLGSTYALGLLLV